MPAPERHQRSRTRLDALVTAEGVELDVDVLELSEGEWAIHGRLAYEGQVIAATFPTEAEAWTALADPGTGV